MLPPILSSAFAIGWPARNVIWLASAAMVGVSGLGLGAVAWFHASALLGGWASVLILAAPAFAVASIPGPEEGRLACDAADLDDTVDRLHRAESALKIIRGARAVAFMGSSYALVLWFCESGGIISARQFVISFTLVCAVSLAAYLPWLARDERRAREVLEFHRQVLEEFKAGRQWGSGSDERESGGEVL